MDAKQWPPRRRWLFGLAIILLLAVLGLLVGPTLLRPPSMADWGPLAVVETREQPAARDVGTLRITETCVGLVHGDGRGALLVWPADRVTWLAAERAVGFRNLDGTVHLLQDGTNVVLRGGGGVLGPDGRPADRGFDWVTEPDPGCSFAEYFLVADVMAE